MVAEPRRQLNLGGSEGTSNFLQPGTTIHRGEIRRIGPTPKFPDPSTADLSKLLPDYLNRSWGRSVTPRLRQQVEITRLDHTVGTNWSPSLHIAHRFAEPMGSDGGRVQTGVPMPPDEAQELKRMLLMESSWRAHKKRYSPDPHSSTIGSWRDRAERDAEDKNLPTRYMDLSGPNNQAKPFLMGVIWHGSFDPDAVDPDELATSYEKEIVLRRGATMTINGATVQIPRPGERGSYPQRGLERGDWRKVEFPSPIRATVDNRSRWVW